MVLSINKRLINGWLHNFRLPSGRASSLCRTTGYEFDCVWLLVLCVGLPSPWERGRDMWQSRPRVWSHHIKRCPRPRKTATCASTHTHVLSDTHPIVACNQVNIIQTRMSFKALKSIVLSALLRSFHRAQMDPELGEQSCVQRDGISSYAAHVMGASCHIVNQLLPLFTAIVVTAKGCLPF